MTGRESNGQFGKGNTYGKGRPKGSRNRYTVAMMDELMREDSEGLEFHPMQEAKRLYRSTEDDRIKVALLKEMLSFGNDKQFVEVEQTEEHKPVTTETMLELYKELHSRFGNIET
ncbi:hypothetical protein VME0621_03877 [Vibrio mediterranei]|uniref:hypothetical protein n=1 Tax=Vibrio mediterranei TaxID=689 RepID=UPI0007845972|nr:hypothetical protein [Vibrio mediterranei]SBO11741.1 hypothetical protein VME0621_03877 [Vibrio mediterranei]